MHALVVYESLYGNTKAVAEAIAASLRTHGLDTEVGPTSGVPPERAATTDLLVIGGPTHAHGMSRDSTRKQAVEDAKNTFHDPTVAPGLREWMDGLPAGAGHSAAAFDTRIDKPAFLTGSAAKGIARRLEAHGYRLVAKPESFLVTTHNELHDDELGHADAWGATVADLVSAGSSR